MTLTNATTVIDLWSGFLAAWSDIVRDVSRASSWRDVRRALTVDDRSFHVGLMLVMVSMVVYVVSV